MTIWQAGIDIYSAGFYAVILQRQRYGWQMRNWHLWRASPLKEHNVSQGNGFSPELIQALRAWRSRLPKRISFRIALPAEAILQQTLPLPDGVESSSARQWLVEDAMDRLFPLSVRELAVDYRVISASPHDEKTGAQAVVSATRRKEMASLLSCLSEAGIAPDIVDAAPCVLRTMAQAAGVDRGALLLHRMKRRYMWVSPLNDAFCYQLLPEVVEEPPIFPALQACEAYRLAGGDAQRVLLSGEIDESEAQSGAALWSPLAAIDQMNPPLPPEDHRFVLACGLALREEDR